MSAIDIVIADPCFLIREGLKQVVEKQNINLKGEIASSNEFWSKVKKYKPAVLITDYNLKNFIQQDDFSRVIEAYPDTKILVISGDDNKENIFNAIQKGISGYLTKECGREEILNAINSVAKGEKFFCNKILDIILEKKVGENKDNPGLSERETEIIKLIAQKYSNQEIAEELFISIHTVYTHRKNIMKKLKLKSPVELILFAIDSGIISS
jgi:two-component system invasion response regulator UvrY